MQSEKKTFAIFKDKPLTFTTRCYPCHHHNLNKLELLHREKTLFKMVNLFCLISYWKFTSCLRRIDANFNVLNLKTLNLISISFYKIRKLICWICFLAPIQFQHSIQFDFIFFLLDEAKNSNRKTFQTAVSCA